MKLFELGVTKPSAQAAKVFESYFGDSINVNVISPKQARTMLAKVRSLVNEHKATAAFHKSEQNPAYLKLMMMERVLAAKVKETSTVPVGAAAGAQQNVAVQQSNVSAPNPTVAMGNDKKQAQQQQQSQQAQQQLKQAQQAKISTIQDPKAKSAMQKAQAGQSLNPEEQQLVAGIAMQTESRQLRRQIYRILKESEVQQAQVVLAAQDMVDEVQKMSEQVSSMQFKDLPALVDQIKNQVGVDQAMQFNTDTTAALAGLLQNLQGAKQQLDQALGVVTGQAQPQLPGDEGMGGELGGDELGGDELGGDELGGDELGGDELPPEPEEFEEPTGGAGLGRAKR